MDHVNELAAALIAAQTELHNPSKAKEADAGKYKYKYTDFAEVIDIVRPVFAKFGLTMLHTMEQQETGAFVMVALLLHTSGQTLRSVFPVPSGLTAQELGSWMSYIRRYSTQNMAFLAGDDDDGSKATTATQSQLEDAENAKKAKAADALKRMKAAGKHSSAYTGEKLTPDKPLNPAEETLPAQGDDLSLVNPSLREAMQKAGITRAQLHTYYVAAGHFPANVRVEDISSDYIELLLKNWQKVITKIEGSKK